EWSSKPLSEKDVRTARAQLKTTADRIKSINENHSALQDIIRRSLLSQERAIATADAHRIVRRQSLQDVKETREAGKQTEKKAKEVLGKIRVWEKTARVGEKIALEVAGAVTQRAECLRDEVERLVGGMQEQNVRMDILAVFRVLHGPFRARAPPNKRSVSRGNLQPARHAEGASVKEHLRTLRDVEGPESALG
ncbi:unnamed protein product, partial [Pylaiella littoralis]